jgi:hypothetical protein
MIFLWLIIGHFVCDYPLQGDFLSRAKNRYNPIPGVPAWQALLAHASIHAGSVLLITHSPLLALCEAVAHMLIDDTKCAGKISYNVDQAFHFACKIGIALNWYWLLA